jgi:hypothetical protein
MLVYFRVKPRPRIREGERPWPDGEEKNLEGALILEKSRFSPDNPLKFHKIAKEIFAIT